MPSEDTDKLDPKEARLRTWWLGELRRISDEEVNFDHEAYARAAMDLRHKLQERFSG